MIAIRLQFLLVLVLVGPVVGVEPGVDYLPPETRMILRTNTQVLLASPLLKKTNILANPVAFSPVGGKFVTQIDRVLIGYPATDAPDKGTTVVLGKFDLAAFDAEMATAVKESKVKVNETPEGKIYERQGVVKMLPGIPKSDHVYFALLDAETLIASVQEDAAIRRALEIKSGKLKVEENKKLTKLITGLDAKDAFFLSFQGKFPGELPPGLVPGGLSALLAPLVQSLKPQGEVNYDGAQASIRLEQDLRILILVQGKNARANRELAGQARNTLTQFVQGFTLLAIANQPAALVQQTLAAVKVQETPAGVSISIVLPELRAKDLLKLFQRASAEGLERN